MRWPLGPVSTIFLSGVFVCCIALIIVTVKANINLETNLECSDLVYSMITNSTLENYSTTCLPDANGLVSCEQFNTKVHAIFVYRFVCRNNSVVPYIQVK